MAERVSLTHGSWAGRRWPARVISYTRRPRSRIMNLARSCAMLVPVLAFTLISGPAAAVIKVACIGASTTKGSGSTAGHHYPDELQKLLGAEYKTYNYGVSAA